MRAYDVIKKKRDGYPLSDEEIRFFVKGYTEGSIPDYQAAAFLMAVYFRGMNASETVAFTREIADSGDTMLQSVKSKVCKLQMEPFAAPLARTVALSRISVSPFVPSMPVMPLVAPFTATWHSLMVSWDADDHLIPF